jgi:hypothetical protein
MSPSLHVGDYVSLFDDHNRVVAGLVESVDATQRTARVRLNNDATREVPFSAVHPLGVKMNAGGASQPQGAADAKSQLAVAAAATAQHVLQHSLSHVHVGGGGVQQPDAMIAAPAASVACFLLQLFAPLAALLRCSRPGVTLGFVLLITLAGLCTKHHVTVGQFTCSALAAFDRKSTATTAAGASTRARTDSAAAAAAATVAERFAGAVDAARSALHPAVKALHRALSLPARGPLTALCAEHSRIDRLDALFGKTKAAFEDPQRARAERLSQSGDLEQLSRAFGNTLASLLIMFALLLCLSVGGVPGTAVTMNVSDERFAAMEQRMCLRDAAEDDDDDEEDVAPPEESQDALLRAAFVPDSCLREFLVEQKGFFVIHGVVILLASVIGACMAFEQKEGQPTQVHYRSAEARVMLLPAEPYIVALRDAVSAQSIPAWLLESITINAVIGALGRVFKKKKPSS